MKALTTRQQEVFDLIRDHISQTGMPPTRAEIAQRLGFRSPNAAEEHLKALARKGVIEIVSGASRGIRLLQEDETGLPLIGRVARMSEESFTSTFIDGARDLLGVALIIGIARGIVVVMDNGMITHTILHSAENLVSGLSTTVFINVTYWIEVVLSFLVPSSSGLAVLTMPIMAPLADFAHVGRDLVVTAYQSASGIVNLITPTSAVVMGGLAIARVPYVRYLKWVAPLILILTVLNMAALSLGALF